VPQWLSTWPTAVPHWRTRSCFYGSYLCVAGVALCIVLLPGISLIPALVLTQVLNAVLLLPLLIFMYGLARDPELMAGRHVRGASTTLYLATIALVSTCIGALFVLTLL
jgi:Mn2+/Fe2+ NRAMP family transporter